MSTTQTIKAGELTKKVSLIIGNYEVGHSLITVVENVEFSMDDEGREVEKETKQVVIDFLFVDPNHRGKGYAKILLEDAIVIAKEIQKDYDIAGDIYIVCNPKEDTVDFDRLYNFYESYGLNVVVN